MRVLCEFSYGTPAKRDTEVIDLHAIERVPSPARGASDPGAAPWWISDFVEDGYETSNRYPDEDREEKLRFGSLSPSGILL